MSDYFTSAGLTLNMSAVNTGTTILYGTAGGTTATEQNFRDIF